MIGVSAYVINSQGYNAVAKVFPRIVVREEFPKSNVLGLSSDEEEGRRSLIRGILQLPYQLTYTTKVEKPEVVDPNHLQPR
jgi:hypothetical protein